MSAPPLTICIIYDRVYPASIGGAERWYRLLAEQLAAAGQHVTYLTACHWDDANEPHIPGVDIVTCASQQQIYDHRRRRVLPVLAFSLGVAKHLFANGAKYDVVHSSAMLSGPAIACVALSTLRRFKLVLDWWEIWTMRYWRSYLGRWKGLAGWLLQLAVALSPHQPVAHSALHARRLRRLRRRGTVPIERGLLATAEATPTPAPAEPRAVFLGRHIPEKQVPAIIPALVAARQQVPALCGTIFGTGPDAANVRRAALDANLQAIVDLPGFASEEVIRRTLRHALCLILPSRREGYALVVAEAAALGVPSVVLRHPDSAAAELIVDGVNGVIIESVDPASIASAILRIYAAGYRLRQRTLSWNRDHATELSIQGSLPRLVALYRGESINIRAIGQS